MSKAKKKTVGERIAADINLPIGYGGHKIRRGLSRRINALVRRAVKEAYVSGLYFGYYSKQRPSLTVTNRVTYHDDLTTKYGVNL